MILSTVSAWVRQQRSHRGFGDRNLIVESPKAMLREVTRVDIDFLTSSGDTGFVVVYEGR
jgi:hypothetical protein